MIMHYHLDDINIRRSPDAAIMFSSSTEVNSLALTAVSPATLEPADHRSIGAKEGVWVQITAAFGFFFVKEAAEAAPQGETSPTIIIY
jgi:hypothetical protein